MSRKKKAAEHVNHERWLISYGDFITLLFALFVVLFASSQVDRRKTVAVAQAIQIAFQQLGVFSNGRGERALDQVRLIANASKSAVASDSEPDLLQGAMYRKGELEGIKVALGQVLAPEIALHEVHLRMTRDGLVISLQEIGFFDSGSAVMKPDAIPVLQKISGVIATAPENLRVEGHTDDVPIHNSQYRSNWQLSTARATEVLDLLITRFDISPERLSAAGYAQYHPIASNVTAQGRSLNRRVDIVVLRTDVSNPPPILPGAAGTPGGLTGISQ
ncbi:MAG TPA: flagellar motor protein MotB [Terriglobia bacterium]|nr:flagellar motor protein MotB [Terriglobia bacterium]